MYLAMVVDCYLRELTGFAIDDHMRTKLIEEALMMTHGDRSKLNGAAFRSDQDSACRPKRYRKLCERFGITQSLGPVGTSADNSLAESFNATLKRKVLQDSPVFAS